jgi:hypothetical protein
MSLRFCPRGNSGSGVTTILAPTTTRRRIEKMLPKRFEAHSGWHSHAADALSG